MEHIEKSGCGCEGGCNQCNNSGSEQEKNCQGGCGGCEGSKEVYYIDEYGEMDEIGVPIQTVVLDVIEDHVFIDELKCSLEKQGYEVLLSVMKEFEGFSQKEDQTNNFTFRCNGEMMLVSKEELNDPSRRQDYVKKTEQRIVAPNRNCI